MNLFSILFLLFISIYSKRITQKKNYISNLSDVRKTFFNNTVKNGSLQKTLYLKSYGVFRKINQSIESQVVPEQVLLKTSINESEFDRKYNERKFPDKNDLGFILKIIFLLLV